MTAKHVLAWKLQVLGHRECRNRGFCQNPPRGDSCFREHIQPEDSWVLFQHSHLIFCIWDSGQKGVWWLMSPAMCGCLRWSLLGYVFCLWGHLLLLCSYTVGKILHPPYLTTAHHPSKISKWPSSAPLHSRSLKEMNSYLIPPPT